jgi:hypothetical protein
MHDSDTSADCAAQDDSAKIPASYSDPFLAFAIELGFDRRKKLKKNERHITVALAVLAQMRAHRQELISAPGGAWLYSDGAWQRLDKKWLAVQVEIACIGLGFNSDTKLVNETLAWLLRQPELWRDRAPKQDCKRSGVR